MFRRNPEKEDNLFTTNTEQGGHMSGDTTTTATTATTTAQPAASANGSTPAPTATAPTSQPGSPSRVADPRPDTRANPAPSATTFRPSSAPMSSMGADMSRSRMPETKINTAPPISTSLDKSGKGSRRVLTVGNDILLKGEIATCDRLVIEGKVDATLNDVHTVEIAETGSFKGSANIEDAEISGLFEGDLVVRNRLVIYATGKVRGKISYGEIEIERGGELTGEIKTTSPVTTTTSPRPTRSIKNDDKVAA